LLLIVEGLLPFLTSERITLSITPNDKPLVVLGSVFTQKEILRLSTSIRALPAQRFAKVISNRSSIVFVAMPNDYRETFRRSRCFFVVKVFFFPLPTKKRPKVSPEALVVALLLVLLTGLP
jgi:hypothetical protein